MRSTTKSSFSLGRAHHQRAVGVVEADVGHLQRRAAELDGALLGEGLVGQRGGRVLDDREALLGLAVRDDLRARVLERLAAGDVVVVVVAVDEVLDRLVGDLPDLGHVRRAALRPAVGDRVGGDHTLGGDDEDRLVIAVAEDVDVVGALRPWWSRSSGGAGACAQVANAASRSADPNRVLFIDSSFERRTAGCLGYYPASREQRAQYQRGEGTASRLPATLPAASPGWRTPERKS